MKAKDNAGTRPAADSPRPHPRSDDLAGGIRRCRATAWSGKFLCCTGVDYANGVDLISGEGSGKYGGRYNPIGIRAVYGSLDLDTATGELLAHHRRQGRPDPEATVFPFTAVCLEAVVERMLDLTGAGVRRRLRVRYAELVGELWQDLQNLGREALTQAIGRLVREAGYQAVLFPSAVKRRGKNIVLFPDILPPGGLRILHLDKLPPKKS